MTLCYYTSEMACPYFYPLEPRSRASDVRDAMLPLGDSWAGMCRAAADSPTPPEEGALRPLCNLGYARETCSRFPSSAGGPDAVRFTISRDGGDSIGLYYVIERDHHPFAHGRLEYAAAAGALAGAPDDLLARQALAYLESYRRRKSA